MQVLTQLSTLIRQYASDCLTRSVTIQLLAAGLWGADTDSLRFIHAYSRM